jgi:predicted RNase H-like nuclease
MKLKEFRTRTIPKKRSKTYVIGNAERERELEKQLFEISEEVRQARLDLAELDELRRQYAEQGAELNVFRRKAKLSDELAQKVEDVEKALTATIEKLDAERQKSSSKKV